MAVHIITHVKTCIVFSLQYCLGAWEAVIIHEYIIEENRKTRETKLKNGIKIRIY